MNKKISTGVGIAAVAVAAIIVSTVIWFALTPQTQTLMQTAPAPSHQLNSMQGKIENKSQPTETINKLDFSKIQFDACGGKAKYEKMPWWNKFGVQVGKLNYYTENYIDSAVKDANKNDTLNPNKIKYSYETFCNDKNFKDSVVCGDGKNKKMSLDDFKDYGEGCLSKDGSVFVAVFPGEYMGGGNYIFRYDIINDSLEAAQKIDENQAYGSAWVDPPSVFGKRFGDIIKMTGGGGDAGCGSNTQFDYDFVSNQIKMIKRCTSCQQEKAQCETFK